MSNPYSGLKDIQFWRRAVSRVERHLVDPVPNPKFRISRETRIATAGSCFAQHISRKIKQLGFCYYAPESGESLSGQERQRRHFGVFSARYGNIYTARQLLQLFEEAFEGRLVQEHGWRREDGRFVDPYRPQIEPDGFADEAEVITSRQNHLEFVRSTFLNADVLVFTLGLSEAWRSRLDGFVFPLAPGVAGGSFDPNRHEFVNFGVDEVSNSLIAFLEKLKDRNSRIQVLLTVSPVPLIATYEDRHVLVSTCYSKSVLRVAADVAARRYNWVDYFPSYEIITGSHAGGAYYEDDCREVSPRGVEHAMRCFVQAYVRGPERETRLHDSPVLVRSDNYEMICDEEAIDIVRPSA